MLDSLAQFIFENAAKISAFTVLVTGFFFAIYRVIRNIFLWKTYAEKSYKMQEALLKEFQPNGGTSFSDKISKIEKTVVTINDRLVRQESLRKGYRRFISTPVWESSLDGGCVAANLAIQKLTGTPEEDFLQNNWQVFIHKDDRENVFSEWTQAIAQKRRFNMQYRVVNQNDQKVYKVHAYTMAIENDVKETIGWIGWYETVEEVVE